MVVKRRPSGGDDRLGRGRRRPWRARLRGRPDAPYGLSCRTGRPEVGDGQTGVQRFPVKTRAAAQEFHLRQLLVHRAFKPLREAGRKGKVAAIGERYDETAGPAVIARGGDAGFVRARCVAARQRGIDLSVGQSDGARYGYRAYRQSIRMGFSSKFGHHLAWTVRKKDRYRGGFAPSHGMSRSYVASNAAMLSAWRVVKVMSSIPSSSNCLRRGSTSK